MKATKLQWRVATDLVPDPLLPLRSDGEVFEVLDSEAGDEDIYDNLQEYRMWRTPDGRRTDQEDA